MKMGKMTQEMMFISGRHQSIPGRAQILQEIERVPGNRVGRPKSHPPQRPPGNAGIFLWLTTRGQALAGEEVRRPHDCSWAPGLGSSG